MAYSPSDFQFSDYMEWIAINLLEFQHSDEHPCFSRVSSLPGLEEYLANIRSNTGFQLVIVDSLTGRYNDNSTSDNLFDRQVFTFFIFSYVELNNFQLRNETILKAKEILDKITSKFFMDRMAGNDGMQHLERSSINYDTIGPVGNNCHGLMVHFTIKDFKDYFYDERDWNIGPILK